MNLIRVFAVLLAGFILAALAGGQPPTTPPQAVPGIKLKIELTDGQNLEVNCSTKRFRLEADYGTMDLTLDKIKSIDFIHGKDGFHATLAMRNDSRIKGKPLTTSLQLEGEKEPMPVERIRQLKVIQDVDTSLLALAFGLITLTVMEIVLGIDNIIFLAIVAGRLPPAQQPKARRIGLVAALATRLGLLFTLSFLLGLTKPVIVLPGLAGEAAELSWRDIILLVGGAFLIVKSVRELHHKLEESREENKNKVRATAGFFKTIILIAIIDIVFSLDSVITAVGMVDSLPVMVTAMVIAMGVMMLFAEPVSRFVEKHPTVKVLALSFLILIGVLLVAEGLGQHIEKGYVYFAMAFAVLIEFINMRLRPKSLAEAVSNG